MTTTRRKRVLETYQTTLWNSGDWTNRRAPRQAREGSEGMIGSDFKWVTNPATRYCDCHRKVKKGEQILASIRNGKVYKYVCSEDCRLEFDNRFWQGVVRARESKEAK